MTIAYTEREVEGLLDERDALLMRIIRLEEKVHNLEVQEETLQGIIIGMSNRIAAQAELLERRAGK